MEARLQEIIKSAMADIDQIARNLNEDDILAYSQDRVIVLFADLSEQLNAVYQSLRSALNER